MLADLVLTLFTLFSSDLSIKPVRNNFIKEAISFAQELGEKLQLVLLLLAAWGVVVFCMLWRIIVPVQGSTRMQSVTILFYDFLDVISFMGSSLMSVLVYDTWVETKKLFSKMSFLFCLMFVGCLLFFLLVVPQMQETITSPLRQQIMICSGNGRNHCFTEVLGL